jgi:hypothetical protein
MTETIEIVIKGKSYRTEPLTVGKLVDLTKMRNTLTNGQYGQIYRHALVNSDNSLQAIDIQAFFMVFCPSLIKDLKVDAIFDLGIEDYKEIKDIYKAQVQTWLIEVESLLRDNTNE